jgi:hypothetical protein
VVLCRARAEIARAPCFSVVACPAGDDEIDSSPLA